MEKEAQKFTGSEVKELLKKAVGGIYINRYSESITDFFPNFMVTNEGLEIAVDEIVTAKMPINEEENYINYAVGGTCYELDEEWEGSVYFGFKFVILNYTVSFNIVNKGCELTWEQFREFAVNDNYVSYDLQSVDCGCVVVHMNRCRVDIDNDCKFIELRTGDSEVEIETSEIDRIVNDSVENKELCYRIEFNNGMPDLSIEPESSYRVF